MKIPMLVTITALFATVSGSAVAGKDDDAQVVVYTARKIITMERADPAATAVAVRDGRIIAVGTLNQVRMSLGDAPTRIDATFADKIVMPGFIEQHLHPVLGALSLYTAVIAPEDWILPDRTFKAARSSQEYRQRLKDAERSMGQGNEWLFSWGYHALWHGKLDRRTLDRISRTRPIAVWHRSCHEFYFNTAAMKALGLDAALMAEGPTAKGMFDLDAGHFWEQGAVAILPKVLAVMGAPERMAAGLRRLVGYLHQNGVTAFNEPAAMFTPDMWKLYQQILGDAATPFYSFFFPHDLDQANAGLSPADSLAAVAKRTQLSTTGKVRFLPNQIKLFADGAIVSQLMQMKDGYLDGHHGEWIMRPAVLDERSKIYWNAGYQAHTHVNGDAGLDALLDVLERRMREHPRYDHRSVIVHFANSTEAQVDRIAHLGAIVSANPYYPVGFADKYGEVGLGPERADLMVRANSVIRRGIRLSYHSDLPIAPADPLFLAWCGVNRITPTGRIAGSEQRIDVDAALRAVTVEAAFSWREENELGSIAPGKLANFTILEQDPYAVEPIALNQIPIWGTVFEGRVYPVPPEQVRARVDAWRGLASPAAAAQSAARSEFTGPDLARLTADLLNGEQDGADMVRAVVWALAQNRMIGAADAAVRCCIDH